MHKLLLVVKATSIFKVLARFIYVLVKCSSNVFNPRLIKFVCIARTEACIT